MCIKKFKQSLSHADVKALFREQADGLRPWQGPEFHEIPYSEAQRIYEEQAKDKLPLTEAEFREVISAEYMVFGRKGLGRPNIVEENECQTMKSLSQKVINHGRTIIWE